jgi:pyruvate dehydrogenase E2 component (dihydrolipoyllysine-residue acetyltransferase)
MPYEFRLPDLGEGIAEVELRRWLVKEGDRIAEHQTVVEVESDKAVVEVPAPRAGIVVKIHQAEGVTVLVGAPLITIAEPGEGEEPVQRSRPAGIVGVLPEEEEGSPAPEKRGAEVLASPMVRRLARELGVDLGGIRGSGPRGSITPEDLERAAAREPATDEFGPAERVPLRGMRRTIARNVLASQRFTAFVSSMEEADITDLCLLRDREQQEAEAHGTHMTYLPFFIKAAQHALREHPYLNAAIDDAAETIVLKKHYHFGIAVETTDGLMVPVIRDVDKKSILELAEEIQRLGQRARERTISREELRESSFSITNYGHFGGTFATPIINWPDVAILGFGRIVERPWVYQGEIAIRRILPLSLTFDHRATDGADAAAFLGRVVRYLEDPALLLIESV